MVPFFFRQIENHMLQALVMIILCTVFAFALCNTEQSGKEIEAQIKEAYQNIPVRFAVTNPKGTQLSRLAIPENLIRLFFPKEGDWTGFQSYLENPQGHMLLHCYWSVGSTNLNGVTSMEVMPELSGLQWKDGYDETVFSESGFWCIAPREAREERVQLYFPEGENIPLLYITENMQEFTVVATHHGTEFYCGFTVTEELSRKYWNVVEAESLSATIKDNTKLEEFRTTCAGKYFGEPSLREQGKKPYALAFYDERLRETEDTLRQSQMFLNMSMAALWLVSLCVGLIYSFLCLRSRSQELRLQYILGVKKLQILCAALLEQGIFGMAGIVLGSGIYFIRKGTVADIDVLVVYWMFHLFGTILAYLITMRKQFLNTGIGGE